MLILRLVRIGVSLMVACFFAGCAIPRTPVLPYYGTIFNQTSAPVDITFENNAIGDRTGKSSAYAVMGLLSWGDASIQTAAANGQIARVDHVDCMVTNVLCGLWGKYETIVYGSGGQ